MRCPLCERGLPHPAFAVLQVPVRQATKQSVGEAPCVWRTTIHPPYLLLHTTEPLQNELIVGPFATLALADAFVASLRMKSRKTSAHVSRCMRLARLYAQRLRVFYARGHRRALLAMIHAKLS